jgi:ankyrin repeat protein
MSLLKRDIFVRRWLLEAAGNNLQKMTEMLKDQPSVAIEKDPFSGFTALHWAAKNGNTAMVKCLVTIYGVNVDGKSHGGYTALHLASKYRRPNTCKALVNELDANLNIRDNYGRTANYYTIKQNYVHRKQYVSKAKTTSISVKKSSQSPLQLPRFMSLDGL